MHFAISESRGADGKADGCHSVYHFECAVQYIVDFGLVSRQDLSKLRRLELSERLLRLVSTIVLSNEPRYESGFAQLSLEKRIAWLQFR